MQLQIHEELSVLRHDPDVEAVDAQDHAPALVGLTHTWCSRAPWRNVTLPHSIGRAEPARRPHPDLRSGATPCRGHGVHTLFPSLAFAGHSVGGGTRTPLVRAFG